MARSSFLAPLGNGAFRMLWIVSLVSNIGTWMQTVGAQWLLLREPDATVLVALVQTATSLPVVLLAIPSGVIAELLNRRRLLIGVQLFQTAAGVLLTVLAATGRLDPITLLALTFIIGAATAVQGPAYQAIVPDVVSRAQLTDAAALSSVGINIARVIGPAVAGALVAVAGVPWVFAANALSFLVFLAALVAWRGYSPPIAAREAFFDATRAGIRYVRNAPVVRRILLRLGMFMIPANALWALLPIVASSRLGLDSGGYGLLLAALGIGSIGGAFLLPPIRTRLGLNRLILVSTVVFGVVTAIGGLSTSLPLTLVALAFGGLAWIAVVASLNGAAQSFLPAWVRARGLSVYQIVLFGGTALGSALAGALAAPFGYIAVLAAAGVVLLLVAASQLIWTLRDLGGRDRVAQRMPLSEIALPPAAEDSGTVVVIDWTVAEHSVEEFVQRMAQVELVRRRTGARFWGLYRDPERPGVLVETFRLGSWREHLNQHENRYTGDDLAIVQEAASLAEGNSVAHHLIAVRDRRGSRRTGRTG